jgi:hypothetical protein
MSKWMTANGNLGWAGLVLALGATMSVACGGGKDSGGCDDGSVVTVTLTDSSTGNPTMGDITWTDAESETGSMSCPGLCEFAPATGAVVITATPSDASLGEAQTETTTFTRSADCSAAVFNGVDFVW